MRAPEGLRVGVDAIGGSGEFLVVLRRAMQSGGADASKTTFLAMGFQNTPPSLIAGAIDAAVLTPPTEFQLTKSGARSSSTSGFGRFCPRGWATGGIGTTDRMIRGASECAACRAARSSQGTPLCSRKSSRDDRGNKPLSQHIRDAAEPTTALWCFPMTARPGTSRSPCNRRSSTSRDEC